MSASGHGPRALNRFSEHHRAITKQDSGSASSGAACRRPSAVFGLALWVAALFAAAGLIASCGGGDDANFRRSTI